MTAGRPPVQRQKKMNLIHLENCLLLFWLFNIVISDIPKIEAPPKQIEVNQGNDARFTCRVTMPVSLIVPQQLQMKWKHNGHLIFPNEHARKYLTHDDGQTLLVSNVDGNDSGMYTCIASVGNSRDSDYANSRLIVREPPEAPRDLSVISCSGNTVTLTWTPGNNGGAEIGFYIVQFNTSENAEIWENYHDEIPSDVQTAHIHLSPWGTYNFRILAKNDVDLSTPSLPTKRQCTTPPERPSGNPKGVRTLTHKQGKLIIVWEPVKRLLHYGPGFKYAIYWRRKGSTYWNKNIVDNSNAKLWEVSVNDTYTPYEIKVKAMNQIGDSRQPPFIYTSFSGEGEPAVIPKDFRLDPSKPIEAHKAHFIWEAVNTSAENIKGEFKGYKVRYWKSSEGRLKWKEVEILITKEDHIEPDVRAAVDELPANTALRAQVSVMNTHFTGPPTQPIDFFTPEGMPDPVRDLRVEAHGSTYVLLKWLPPEEPNGQLLGYDIGYQQINGDKKGKIKALRPQIENPEYLGARITGLTANHDYRFYVWARTKAGKGDSVYLDIRTEEGELSGNPQPKFATLDQTSVNITWTSYKLKDVSYVVEYKLASDGQWSIANSKWGHNWMVITNLSPNTEYELRLVAKNRYGDTASSALYRVKTHPIQESYQQDQPYRYTDGSNGSSNIHHGASSTSSCVKEIRILLTTVIYSLVTMYFVL